jgi:hypothetical protein
MPGAIEVHVVAVRVTRLMTTVVVGVRPTLPALGRGAALLVLASAVVHVLQVSGSSLGSLLMAAMALTCLPCGWHLWRSPTASVWRLTVAVDVGMLLGHLTLLAGSPHAMHHPGSSGLMWLGVWLVVGQLVLAAIVAVHSRAARSRGADQALAPL